MKALCVVLTVLVCSADARIKTVDELDLTKYDGRWYEMYNSLIQRLTFEKNFFCTTADYTLIKGIIKVVNSGRVGSPTGKANQITGSAKVVDKNFPGELNVKFPVGPQSDKPNYLVVKLGPLTKDGKYAYSIVTSPFKSMLYVLARDPQTFRMKYMNEVFDYLNKNGFNYFWNKPRETYQESDCLYPKLFSNENV